MTRAAPALLRLAGMSLLAALSGPAPAASPVGEYEAKAAFLFNFARFVEWPRGALPPGAPFVVGVLGADPFGGILDDTLAGKSVDGHAVKVVHLTDLAAGGPAPQILFLGALEPRELARVLLQVQALPVLTVAESEGFAQRGVIVNFVVRQRQVRFEVNLARAEKARLKISSQLLQLATRVAPER